MVFNFSFPPVVIITKVTHKVYNNLENQFQRSTDSSHKNYVFKQLKLTWKNWRMSCEVAGAQKLLLTERRERTSSSDEVQAPNDC